VDIMGWLQLGNKHTPEGNAKSVVSVKTLTGDQPQFLMPALPPLMDKTPSPKPFG
jgi:cytochrome c peroxidase